jgi:catechol 2,3-dioxygenase-like lactoylglutathione lyase family enzyme
MKVDNVGLAVRDLDAVLAFFEGPLGLAIERYGEDGGASVHFENASMYVFQTPEAASVPERRPDLSGATPGLDHVSFIVEDVDAAHAELAARGVEFIEEPVSKPDWGLRTAAFVDPERNLYFLIKPLES